MQLATRFPRVAAFLSTLIGRPAAAAPPPAPAQAPTDTVETPVPNLTREEQLRADLATVRETHLSALTLRDLFNLKTGAFNYHSVFKFNKINRTGYDNRTRILRILAECTVEQFMALPFLCRNNAFTVLKQEAARYKGTARRRRDNTPLPKLEFIIDPPGDPKSEGNARLAVDYFALLTKAERNIARCVRERGTVRAHPQPRLAR